MSDKPEVEPLDYDPDVGRCINCGENWCEETICEECKKVAPPGSLTGTKLPW